MPAKRRGGKGKSGDSSAVTSPNTANPGSMEADSGRTAHATLTSDPRSRDIKMSNFSLSMKSTSIVEDTEIDFRYGGRYGLVGRNGCGKSTFLQCIANREVPIPERFDIYLLSHEADPGEETALEYVINPAKDEIIRIEGIIEKELTIDPDSETIQDLYDRLD